jgi:peptide/nickel transport system permease protein
MRFTDICMSLPFMPIALILASVMSDMGIKPQHRIYYLMVIIGMLSWPQLARLIRGQVLTLREREFMLAAEALGISDSRRILRHLLPNVIPLVMVDATLSIGGSILSESAMSFLGLGVAPPYPSWGNMVDVISDLSNLRRPWIWVPPGVMIVLTVMAVYAVGNGLRDALDPKMMRQGS